MILADTSIWIDHLRSGSPALATRLDRGGIAGHAFASGDLACGRLKQRAVVIDLLQTLPQAIVVPDATVLATIEEHHLMGRGIGYVDAHLLASTLLSPGMALWTRDRRLSDAAGALGCGVGDP